MPTRREQVYSGVDLKYSSLYLHQQHDFLSFHFSLLQTIHSRQSQTAPESPVFVRSVIYVPFRRKAVSPDADAAVAALS